MTMQHELDVVIPAFNAAATISYAIESAYAVGAVRVVVVDDGSSDGTAEVARDAGAMVIRQENAGASVARRVGLAEVTAKRVAMLDADDAVLPGGVAESMRLLESTSGAVAAGGSALGFFKDGTERVIFPNESNPSLESLLKQGFAPIPPACVIWDTETLKYALFEAEPEPLLPRYAEDYEMMLRVAMMGRLVLHRQPSAHYALEGGKSMDDPARSVRSVSQMRDYYSSYFGIEIRHWRERHITARARLRMYKNSRTTLRKLYHLVLASVSDFSLILGLLRSKVQRSRERWG